MTERHAQTREAQTPEVAAAQDAPNRDASDRDASAGVPGDPPAKGPQSDMSGVKVRAQRPPGHRLRVSLWGGVGLVFGGLTFGFGALALTHEPIPVPQFLREAIEARINGALDDRLHVNIGGGIAVVLGEGLVPRVELRMVELRQPSGQTIAVLPELDADFWPEPILHGRLAPRALRLLGATVALRRLADGRFDIDFGGGDGMEGIDFRDPARISAAVRSVFDTPALAALQSVRASDLQVRLDDARLNRVWQVSDGQFDLTQSPDRIALTLALAVGERGGSAAQVALRGAVSKIGPEAEVSAAVAGLSSRDLAVQSPALAMLGLVDAPISGTLRTGIDAQGTLRRLEATLALGAGEFSPAEGAQTIPFESGTMHIAYDPDRQKVTVTDADFTSKALRFRSSGQIYLKDLKDGMPQRAEAQIALRNIEADPEGVFQQPARFDFGAIDLELGVDPFKVRIGQMQLVDDRTRISGRGTASAGAEGWHLAFDAGIDRIDRHDLIALWPPKLVPHTRDWIDENIPTGELHDVHAAVRLEPGEEPRFQLGYEFRGAQATLLNTLPPVQDGRGFATIFDNSHALMIEEGGIDAPEGGRVEVAGSQMVVPDIRDKPARADVTLITRSTIPAALSLLDQKPFEFMKKAGKTPELASGWAEARTELSFLLEKHIAVDDVAFNVLGRLTDVRSDKLVPNRVLTSPELTLRADHEGMVIAGAGMLDQVPFDGRWSQSFAQEERGHSRIDGYAEVTHDGLASLGVDLPGDLVSGTGWGKIAVDLHKDGTDRYDFTTDLKGLSMAIPEIGWSKPAASEGLFHVEGALGHPATVEKMSLTAPGLSASGKMDLTDHGFDQIELGEAQIGSWFRGALSLKSRGEKKAPDVTVNGGTLDLRRIPDRVGKADGAGSGAAQKPGGGTRIGGRLDRLIVTDSIALTGLRGQFTTQNGIAGAFSGKVNGGAPVTGEVGPSEGGRTAIRVSSDDAGGVAASAGITDRTAGGKMVLTLSPIGRQSYDGNLHIDDFRVTKAPTLASLLSAASIVGLVEQLNGDGILFGKLDAAFRLTPDGLSITRAAAEGASMAVTAAGNFFPKTGRIEMEGVVSPFYIINSIGQLISRRGEGLFGVNYRIGGTVDKPEFSVNPLTILAPGALRNLFRTAPETLKTK